MAGYLETYGAGEERRAKFKRWVIAGSVAVVVGLFVWWILYGWDKAEILREQHIARLVQRLRNHKQEGEVNRFLQLIDAHNYTAAYALWGCTDAKPCTGYPMSAFQEDWGPQKDIHDPHIARSRSCGSGVIVTVDLNKNQQERLWVQRSDGTIGFSPFPSCPALQ